MFACSFYSYLRTSSSSFGVCGAAMFKASTKLFVSKMWGFEVSPHCDVGNFLWFTWFNILGFEVSTPYVDVESSKWGMKFLPPYVGVKSSEWGLKCPPHIWVLNHLGFLDFLHSICHILL